MFWLSRRSMRSEPTRIATPSVAQPVACFSSERAIARTSASDSSSWASCSIAIARSWLGDADGVGRDLGLAVLEQHPRVGLNGREDGLLRRLAGRRREQRAATGGVLLERVALGDGVGPDLLDGLDDLVGNALRNED